jgi:hypothetical protein
MGVSPPKSFLWSLTNEARQFDMDTQTTTKQTTPPTPTERKPAPKRSIAKRLAAELPKEDGQIVKATNVFGAYFRVNWYWPLIVGEISIKSTGKIAKSQFLRVEIGDDDKLVIEDRTATSGKRRDLLSQYL